MPDAEARELLQDAALVLHYAARAGRLADDALVAAINRVRSASPDAVSPELPALVAALNGAVRSIAPMTLVELRAGLSPFDRKGQARLRKSQVIFAVLTIVLATLVADYTEYLHRQDTAMTTLRQLQESHPLEKLNDLRKMVQIEAVLSKHDPIHYDKYHRSTTELRDLLDRLSSAYEVLKGVKTQGTYLSRLAHWVNPAGPLTEWIGQVTRSHPAPADADSNSNAAPSAGGAVTTQHPITPPAQPAVTSYEEAAAAAKADASDVCDERVELPPGEPKKYPPWVKLIVADSQAEQCFSEKLRLSFNSLPPTAPLFFDIQTSMATLNGWVLPFLYGLLGASVFVMRMLLDPRAPTLGFAPALLRVSLGGIAGIIIGWFSISTGATGQAVPTISVVPFGLAFCAGFSIEILFSVLDRINKTLTDQTPSSPKPA
jgi:hypothetical protein